MATSNSFCTNCGTALDSSVNFCSKCGAQQSGVDSSPSLILGVQSSSGIFDVLGETFRIYKRSFVYLIGIVAIVQIPLALVAWLVFRPADVPVDDDLNIGYFIEFGIRSVVILILQGSAWILMQGALIHAISELSLGRPIRIQESYAFALNKYLQMLGTLIVSGVAIILMAITVIGIPFAIAFVVYWFFIIQIVMLEGYGTTTAMSRSHKLVRGHWWWLLGFLIVSGLLIGIMSSIIVAILAALIPVIGATIGEVLMAPLLITAQTLFYFELRNRELPVLPTADPP